MPTSKTSPIILLHGINNSPSTWESVAAQLPEGSAFTPFLPPLADVDLMARRLLDELPESFVLVGHSFGGYVSLAMLAAAPERIEALVLVNSLDTADTPAAAVSRREKVRLAMGGGYEELANATTAKTYHPDSLQRVDLMEQRNRAISEYGAARFCAHQEASARRPDRSELLKHASVPTLVVSAADDLVISAARQREMALRAGARFESISGAGHMLPAERPEALANILLRWTDGIASQR
jgi:pimeloyl-ACP methyl ester carboxylesterase